MNALTGLIRSFAALLAPDPDNGSLLRRWITGARAADLPHLHSFTRGLDLDIRAATAALILPHHNRRTEGANTKMIKRQMYGRAGFPSSYTGFSSDDATHRYHRKRDRAVPDRHPQTANLQEDQPDDHSNHKTWPRWSP